MIFGINKQQAGHTGHTQDTHSTHTPHTHTLRAGRGGRLQVWSLLCLSAAGRSFFVMSLSMVGGWANTKLDYWNRILLAKNSVFP